MEQSRLILASASPRRVDLLHSLGVEFEVIPSRAEELHDPALGATQLCSINAERKAAEVAGQHPNRTVLGADTLVTLNGEIFGKPADLKEAFAMLSSLSGRTHQVITGVCLLHLATQDREVFTVETLVTFKSLDPKTIDAYLQAVPVLDKAGAYGIQDHGEMLVERIAGSRTNVVGLPVEKLKDALRRWKVITEPAPDKTGARRN
jgi:septum formation protein